MFARLVVVRAKIDKLDEITRIYEKSVVAAAKSQKGYCGAYLLTDRRTGKGVSSPFGILNRTLLPMNRAATIKNNSTSSKTSSPGRLFVKDMK